ncbi:hypothetical protein [Caulobacter sp. X]|uniref:hypothetical protein n=1 Tax=Caulobacter sp. X TaxID=2048901 RepID=UPI0011783218|nr:hypothetical protein [Caulobacter sp. X]
MRKPEELREVIDLADSAAKRFFDVLARITAVSVLLELGRNTHNVWIVVTAYVATTVFFGWLSMWVLFRSGEIIAQRGTSDRLHKFRDALSFAIQLPLIGMAIWTVWTVAPEIMKALANAMASR